MVAQRLRAHGRGRAASCAEPGLSHSKAFITAGPATSGNWSGFELDRSYFFTGIRPPRVTFTPAYDWVKGSWRVPAVTGELGQTTYSSFWVGLDGDNTVDLVQAGTEQDCLTFLLPFGIIINIAIYYVWTEFLPQQPTEQIVNNFPVSAGDDILTEVWIGNAGSSPALAGALDAS